MHMISKKDLSDAVMDTLTKSCSPTVVITANGEVQTHEEAIVYVKELDIILTMKVLENTPAVLSLGKLCDENGYSYEWIDGQKPHLIKNGIRIICNTENFVPIVVAGLSNSSSGSDSSTSRALSRQGSHCSTSSSSSSSLPTVSETKTRQREDRIESGISPVTVSTTVDERSGRPDIDQANKNPKISTKKTTERTGRYVVEGTERPVILRFGSDCKNSENMETLNASSSHEASLEPTFKRREDSCKHTVYTHFPKDRNCEICKGLKLQGPHAEDAMANPYFVLKILVIQQITRSSVTIAILETITDMQSWVQDLATQWIQTYPWQNKNFTGTPEKRAKVPGARQETQSHLQ